MELSFRWTGAAEEMRITETRLRCYGRSGLERENFHRRVTDDPRAVDGDFLLAEAPGSADAVGTLTSLSMTMWVRGKPMPCQGIAWVGTVRTHRRQSGDAASGPGIASQLMGAAIAKGRERGQAISALMPFRASFYEHFGYGIVETRNSWTVPLSILPTGSSAGMRYAQPDDLTAMAALYQQAVAAGQCNIERGPARWQRIYESATDNGFIIVDPDESGTGLRGYLNFQYAHQNGKDLIEVSDIAGLAFFGIESFCRQLYFLAGQRDQYSGAILRLPADFPLGWLLRERQIPHRPVNHAASELVPHTRMQVRVLDHLKFLENLRLAGTGSGKVGVSVKESEGHVSRFTVDIDAGRVSVRTGASGKAMFTCSDHIWASIACGTLRASTAWRLGLAEADHTSSAQTLDALASPEAGPVPFCQEYF